MFTESIVTLKEFDVELSAKVTVLRTHEPKKWFKKHQSVCCCCCVDTSLAKKIPVFYQTCTLGQIRCTKIYLEILKTNPI